MRILAKACALALFASAAAGAQAEVTGSPVLGAMEQELGRSMAVLKEARNVKYGRFVAPGEVLRLDVELVKETPDSAQFKASGSVGEAPAISARIELAYFSLAERQPELGGVDAKLLEHTKARWAVLSSLPLEMLRKSSFH